MILESNTAEVKVAFKHSSPFGREIVTSATTTLFPRFRTVPTTSSYSSVV